MKKPYAQSTLKRKYRETDLGEEKIARIFNYLNACAHFYQILEIKEARNIAVRQGNVSQKELDKVLPIMERDDSLDFYIINETELYNDGDDKLLMIDKALLLEDNEDFDYEALIRALLTGNKIDTSSIIRENWDHFYALDKQRCGKPLYIPTDILPYVKDGYYEETPQMIAMKQFLLKDCGLNQQERLLARQMDKRFLVKRTPEEIADWTIHDMVEMIKDLSVPMSKHITKAMDILKKMGFFIKRKADMQRFVDLFSDMRNHTRMPSNRGFTPDELFSRAGKPMPNENSFGPGIQKTLRPGELSAAEINRAIPGHGTLPLDMEASLMRAVDQALKPGEEKWVNGTLIKGDKIRPNDPCPCGSGKKYKKCCGIKH